MGETDDSMPTRPALPYLSAAKIKVMPSAIDKNALPASSSQSRRKRQRRSSGLGAGLSASRAGGVGLLGLKKGVVS